MAATRRLAREIALKTLFQVAIGGVEPPDALAAVMEDAAPAPPDAEQRAAWEAMRIYAAALVDGVIAFGDAYDAIVARYARDWDPDRMPVVDRILLHIALHEIAASGDVPHGVAINEAVDLARIYSTEDSPRFLNGLLGQYVRTEGPEAPETS